MKYDTIYRIELSIGYFDTEHCQPMQEWIPLDFNNRIGHNGYWQFDIQVNLMVCYFFIRALYF